MTDFVIHVQVEPPRIRNHSQIRMAGGDLTFWDPNFKIQQRERQHIKGLPFELHRIQNRNICTDSGSGDCTDQRPESGVVWP